MARRPAPRLAYRITFLGAGLVGEDAPSYRSSMAALWVSQLVISEPTAQKIDSRHGLSAQEVRDAVEQVQGLPFTWDFHEVRGWRAIVKVRIRSAEVLVVLYDAAHPLGDVWNLGSAYRV